MQRSLHRRLIAFANVAHRATSDLTWLVVARLRPNESVHPDEWSRWSHVLQAPNLERAVTLIKAPDTPSWLVLALASHRVSSPEDAHSVLYDLSPVINSSHAFPLLILTAHSLAFYSLASLLRPLTSSLPPNQSHASFYFNSLLQAISLFDRSKVAADVAIDVLELMETRRLPLWSNTERVLIRDDFRSPRLLDYLRRRGPSSPTQAWLRAYASLGRVQSSAHCLHTIRSHCLQDGIPPPYTTDGVDITGTAHEANTHYLRAMRDDRRSAFQYFHRLLELDLQKSRKSPSSPPSSRKSNIDIYDWTTALHAAARDRTLPASSLLDFFDATKDGTNAYKPTRATYTVVIQGLLWRNALQDAERLWDQFVREVVAPHDQGSEMRIDRKALCVGIDVLVRSGRAEEALCLLEEAIKKDTDNPSNSPFLKVHPIHTLFSALIRIRRPDAVFYVWTHLTSLYSVPYTNLMLRILLKAAIQASKMDGESLKGAMSWYMADNSLFKKRLDGETKIPSESREDLVAHLYALLQMPAPPSVVGIWASSRSTEVARSIFRGMIFGNWPVLRGATGRSGVTDARAKGGDSVFQEFARVFSGSPDRFLPPGPTPLCLERPELARPSVGKRDEDGWLGPPLPTVVPSESTFATYIALLGLSSRAEEIPEVLVWMRALDVVPKTETLAVALVFWMEVGLRGPVFEDGWRGGDSSSPRTEYGALRAWIREWVGEKKAPGEEDVCAGIKRVREMRDGRAVGVQ